MSKESLVMRMLCSEGRVDAQKLRSGWLSRDEWARLAGALGTLAEAKIFIDDTPGISVLEMRAKARRLAAEQKKLDLIVVDYLQLMSGSSRRSESRQQEVSQISRELKGLAKELNVPLVALSQLSRAPEARSDHRPQLSDLRESGSIEQDADLVAFIYREEQYNRTEENTGTAELIIAKQRNGPTGTVNLAFLKEFTRFENMWRE
jgi:replicative DNA helicase